MQNEVKVGDMVTWSQVPDGALVGATEREFSDMYALRRGHHCCWMTVDGWHSWDEDETWMPHPSSQWRIIATNLTGSETVADLQRLAEIFEVREQLLDPGVAGFTKTSSDEMENWARRLYDAGFRRGMTAEDAARLLAEAVR